MAIQSQLSEHEILNSRLRQTIFRIQDCLDVNRKTFLEMMCISSERYAQIAFQKSDITILELYSLAKALDLDLDLLYSGKLDFLEIARRFRGDLKAVPERYSDHSKMLGRARAAQLIFTHLTVYRGEAFARSYFKRLQLYPEAFSNPTDFVHPQIAMDLMKNFSKEGYSEDQIRGIGSMTLALTPEPLRKQFLLTKTPKNLYSYLIEEYGPRSYDRMFHNCLDRITNDSCRVIISTTQLAQEVFGNHPIDNRESCLYRQGVFSSFVSIFGQNYAKIQEISCVHRGDEKCILDIVWN